MKFISNDTRMCITWSQSQTLQTSFTGVILNINLIRGD